MRNQDWAKVTDMLEKWIDNYDFSANDSDTESTSDESETENTENKLN